MIDYVTDYNFHVTDYILYCPARLKEEITFSGCSILGLSPQYRLRIHVYAYAWKLGRSCENVFMTVALLLNNYSPQINIFSNIDHKATSKSTKFVKKQLPKFDSLRH